jgi:hypothetical protein
MGLWGAKPDLWAGEGRLLETVRIMGKGLSAPSPYQPLFLTAKTLVHTGLGEVFRNHSNPEMPH